ncbi:5-formyltetrahydrofolate cyclo-ligase [Bacillota bacterium Lsc_1132]
MNDKKTIRKQMRASLADLSKPLYEDYSYEIAKRLYEESAWKDASVIGITISNPPEVDTYQIIRKTWEQGKQVAVPKCHPEEKRLTFHILSRFSQLESVFFGLFEPIEKTIRVDASEIDLLLVPGLAYTPEGYRLGFGGGYYDRFLLSYSGETISLAFDFQVIREFPVEAHDIPVAKIITNKQVLVTK